MTRAKGRDELFHHCAPISLFSLLSTSLSMPPSSKTWSRQDGLASKRKRPSAHDFFDDSKKRARPEPDRAVSRDCSPKTPRDSESVVREKVGSVSFAPYPEGQDPQDPRQYSPLFVSTTNECHHDNQTKPFTTRDYPLSPLSHSPEHISDGSGEPTKRGELICPDSCLSSVSSIFFVDLHSNNTNSTNSE